jgi:hypothetical protein
MGLRRLVSAYSRVLQTASGFHSEERKMKFWLKRRSPGESVWGVVCLIMAVMVSPGALCSAAANPPAPIPPAPARAAAEKAVREVFAGDLAKRGAVGRAEAAKKLLAEAGKESSDAAARYVLLDDARELAIEAGDAALAWRAIDALAAGYEVDRSALRSEALGVLLKSANLSAPSAGVAAGYAMEGVDAFCDANDYASALKAMAQAEGFAARSRDGGLQASSRARAAEVRGVAGQYERAREAIEKLKSDPADAEANLAAGSFYCFARGDWKVGLPMLARSSDATLKELAKADLAEPKGAEARKGLADKWWEAAEGRGFAAFKAPMRRRAAHWYEEAAGGLSGLAQTLARKRIVEAGATDDGAGRRVVDLLAMIDPKGDAVNGAWLLEKGKLIGRGGTTARLQIPYAPPAEYDLKLSYAYTTGSEGMMVMLPTVNGSVLLVMNPKDLYFEDLVGRFGKADHEAVARNQSCGVVVRVRKGRVQALVNDRVVSEFDPTARQMGIQEGWRVRDERTLGVGNWNTTVVYSKMELVAVGGVGRGWRGGETGSVGELGGAR